MSRHDIPVVAVVTFPVTPSRDSAELRKILEAAGPDYVNVPGLRRKYFLAGDGVAGGVYEWDSRRRADAFYDEAWHEAALSRYGAAPKIQFYDSPAIADGVNHQLQIFLPEL